MAIDDKERGLRTWHASVAKNTAHRWAVDIFGLDAILVNLDADNIVGAAFAQDVVDHCVRDPWQHVFRHYEGRNPGVAGRMVLHARTFQELNGYDELLFPMGYQDFDLLARFNKLMGELQHKDPAHTPWQQRGQRCKDAKLGGLSIPNDPNPQVARGKAKVRLVAKDLQYLTWGKMNEGNMTDAKAKLRGGEVRRNAGKTLVTLGVPVTRLRRPAGMVAEPLPAAPRPVGPVAEPRPAGPALKRQAMLPEALAPRVPAPPRTPAPLRIRVQTFGVEILARTHPTPASHALRGAANQRGRGGGLGPEIPLRLIEDAFAAAPDLQVVRAIRLVLSLHDAGCHAFCVVHRRCRIA